MKVWKWGEKLNILHFYIVFYYVNFSSLSPQSFLLFWYLMIDWCRKSTWRIHSDSTDLRIMDFSFTLQSWHSPVLLKREMEKRNEQKFGRGNIHSCCISLPRSLQYFAPNIDSRKETNVDNKLCEISKSSQWRYSFVTLTKKYYSFTFYYSSRFYS